MMYRVRRGLSVLVMLTAACIAVKSYAQASVEPLNIMTFNIRYGLANDGEDSWSYRVGNLLNVIDDQHPDVLGVQEALYSQVKEIAAANKRFSIFGESRDGGDEGEYSAIFYDHRRLELLTGGTFWLSDTPTVPSASWGNSFKRICTWAHFLDRTTGKRFYTYNTHLDHESANSREQSAKLLVQKIASRAEPRDGYVLMGDFNAVPASKPITYLLSNTLAPLVDGMTALKVEKPLATFHGFKGGTDGPRIDYIFTSTNIHMTAAEIDRSHEGGKYPSDHYPIIATISFE